MVKNNNKIKMEMKEGLRFCIYENIQEVLN